MTDYDSLFTADPSLMKTFITTHSVVMDDQLFPVVPEGQVIPDHAAGFRRFVGEEIAACRVLVALLMIEPGMTLACFSFLLEGMGIVKDPNCPTFLKVKPGPDQPEYEAPMLAFSIKKMTGLASRLGVKADRSSVKRFKKRAAKHWADLERGRPTKLDDRMGI
jgi:hypothetical protein